MSNLKIIRGIKIKNYYGELENVPYPNFNYYLKVTRDTLNHEYVCDEPQLFQVALFKNNGILSDLFEFRKRLSQGKSYKYLFNKEEISKYLDGSYIVSIKGIGEIENINELGI